MKNLTPQLQIIKQQINEYIISCDNQQCIDLFNSLPFGKMLRSQLILKIAGISPSSLKLCAIIEMIHTSSLLHDDVIDKADTRRGKLTINAKFGDKISILLGDMLYSIAFSQLALMNQNIAYIVANAVTQLSIGEMMDIELANTFNTSYDKYYEMIYKKTGTLIEASSKAAALLASKDSDKYALFGKNLGLAFQMIDDILDITQDSTALGKPSMFDFIDGKVTIPYLLLYERTENKDKLKSLFKVFLSKEDMSWIKEEMQKTKALEDSIAQAVSLGKKALEALKGEDNIFLEELINSMIKRTF